MESSERLTSVLLALYLTVFTLEPKLIIPELWKRKLDWDEELPPDLKHRWNNWKATLHELSSIEILRWYGFKFPEKSALELHVFGDAPSCAYGAVAYYDSKVTLNLNAVL